MVAAMVVMRAALNRGEIGSIISIILRVWGSPYLALLGSSGSFILVGEVRWLVFPLCLPLLLLVGKHPCTLIREVGVVSLSTHVVMWMMVASLRPNLCANWRWRLIGCPTVRSRLLYRSQYAFSYAMWRCVTPAMKKKNTLSLNTSNSTLYYKCLALNVI